MQYASSNETHKRNRSRNIRWFNPPYSKIVSTNVGKLFLKLIDKHFPQDHKFRKLFNRNNVKVSYGCMQNIGGIINSHNKKIIESKPKLQLGACNCRVKANCPLKGHCLTESLLYQATLSASIPNYSTKVYKGITQHPFKMRYNNHNKAFNNVTYRNDCELSKEVWRIKDLGGTYQIEWQVLKQLNSYNPNTKRCALCVTEKLAILEHEGNNLLNKRSEIISKCRHRNKYMLSSATSNDDIT